MHRLIPNLPLITVLVLGLPASNFGQAISKQVPKEVSAIAGTFTGSWAMFGIDGQGQVVKKGAWTDTVKAENPVSKEDRSYVTTTDEMIFEGRPTPMKVEGKEGYLVNKDGSLGDYFIETYGQVIRMQRIGGNIWVYSAPANPRELAALGFTSVSSAQHVLVKVVTVEDGVETHRISRVTTVNWKDEEGKDRWIQYISLQGFHKRRS